MADIEAAQRAFQRAVKIGEAAGSEVPAGQLLKARSSLALTLMRLGRADEAEPVARAIVRDSPRIRGADHPDPLVTKQHWLRSEARRVGKRCVSTGKSRGSAVT